MNLNLILRLLDFWVVTKTIPQSKFSRFMKTHYSNALEFWQTHSADVSSLHRRP